MVKKGGFLLWMIATKYSLDETYLIDIPLHTSLESHPQQSSKL